MNLRVSRAGMVLLAAWLVFSAQTRLRADDSGKVDFDRQVRPILSDKCFACHGPDAEARKSELRLDVRDEALKPAESGQAAIVPGKPDDSPLIRKISNRNSKRVMPPPKTGKTVSDAEIAILRAWIAQGAEYQTHWSFRPPVATKPPAATGEGAWSKNPIDRFLLARMTREGLKPSQQADKTTLIRRSTLDLTGLPPTIAEIDAFLADNRADAYERLVDRLLASPRFGERMAVDWLDASRFADTHGYHIDAGRDMSRWRSWVIDAFNVDMPFDQFTIEQLAGDLLPNPTLSQKIASGFNRNHMINFEGGAIPDEYHTAYIVDRVNTTGTVWLGLTVGCAQCHDHKFDPLKQKDYYSLFAFFHNVPENGLDGSKGNAAPLVSAPSAEQEAKLVAMDARIRDLEAHFTGSETEADARQAQWEKTFNTAASWRSVKVVSATAEKASLKVQDDGQIIADGETAPTETYSIRLTPDNRPISTLRVELLPDERFPKKGPGRSVNGNVVLTEAKVEIAAKSVAIASATADFSQDTFPAANAIDGKSNTGWAIDPREGEAHELILALAMPVVSQDEIVLTLEFRSIFASHQPGRFRVTASEFVPNTAIPAKVRDVLAIESGKRTEAQKGDIRSYYRSMVDSQYRAIAAEIAAMKKDRETLNKAIPTAMVMAEMDKPRDTFILMRGQYDKKGDKVTADVPAFLPPLPAGASKNRLGLARWLVDTKHPLTARVAVNRLWQTIFGTGLVKTSEDFGTQGEQPSHPELLDWLAVEFSTPTDGKAWSVKRLIRLMVTSEAYKQSSTVSAEGLAKDPENRFLSRAPRLRLSAESLRDQALFVSGLLREKIGGPSVSPYNPPGLWEELMSRADGANWSAQTYTQSHGDDLYRRTMYTFWKRTCPPPSLATFDAPDRETCTVRRARTNTPLQALVMLNDPTYVEASRKLAERIVKEGGLTHDERIGFAFRTVASRKPKVEEVAILKRIFETELVKFRDEPAKAAKFLSVGEAHKDEAIDAAELAAWSAVSAVLLNLDEVVTRG